MCPTRRGLYGAPRCVSQELVECTLSSWLLVLLSICLHQYVIPFYVETCPRILSYVLLYVSVPRHKPRISFVEFSHQHAHTFVCCAMLSKYSTSSCVLLYRRRSYTTCTCHHVWTSTRTDGRVRGKGMRVGFMSGIGTSNDRAYQFVTSLLFASFNDGNSFHGPATALPNTPP